MCEECPIRDLLPTPKKLNTLSKDSDYEKEASSFVPCLSKNFNFTQEEIEKSASGFTGGEKVGLKQLDNYITQGI
jgi:hypothetical protein